MIEKYIRIKSKLAIFKLLSEDADLYGVVMFNAPYFEAGIYELKELEVWRVQEMLKEENALIFLKTR